MSAWPSALVGAFVLLACGGEQPATSAFAQPIVGGEPVDSISATVAIVDAMSNRLVCSAIVVAPSVVVTAGHCLAPPVSGGDGVRMRPPSELAVIAGANDLSAAATRNQYSVVALHTPFEADLRADFGSVDGLGQALDIGVIWLDREVTDVKPARLAEPGSHMEEGLMLTISGFGLTGTDGTSASGVLRAAEVPLRSWNSAEFSAGGAGLPDACFGDSGGPAAVHTEHGLEILGVSSRAVDGGATCGAGGIYTLATNYRNWFEEESPAPAETGTGAACSVSSTATHNQWAWSPLSVFVACFTAVSLVRRACRNGFQKSRSGGKLSCRRDG
jgi:secreted trypsin-like serine protease